MRNTVMNRFTEKAKDLKDLFMVTGDAGYGVLDDFQKEFPERYLNMGAAEQNMISFSAGLSMAGFNVVVYNIVPFVLYRCFEQVRNDIAYQELPVTLVGIGSGVTYSPQGVTHYSVEDITLVKTMPNVVICSPSDPKEATLVADFALQSKHPVYIRLAKRGEPNIHEGEVTDITKPIVFKDGSKVAVLFHGSVSIEVVNALKMIDQKPRAISVPMIRPLDFDDLKAKLDGIETIITVEEHYADGGLGSTLAEWIFENNLPFKLKKLGIKHEFIHVIKNNEGMRKHYGISADNIAKVIQENF